MATLDDFVSFLQGASNSAASNLSAPVDGINWLLGKAGLPVSKTPVGGSDWLREVGFTAEPKNRNAGLLGEAVGGVMPIVSAAKAPQIAAGLNRVAANAAAPRALHPQTGAIVWHGSPHKFDRFDSSKIGAGEGSQAYGYGHYVAESPDVARSYSVMAQKPARRQAGVSSAGKDQAVLDSLIRLNAKRYTGGNVAELVDLVKSRPAAFANPDGMIARASEYIDNLPPSYMYKIDLPDEHVAKMIDLENAVPESIRAPLSQKALDEFGSGFSLGDGTSLLKQLEFEFKSKGSNHPAKDAANWLRQQGVPGLKFKDAGTRNMADGGTSNFVVFPGNEGLLSILERNGQPLR